MSIMDLHYLIAENGKDIEHIVDRHLMGLFEVETTLEIMKSCGFDAKFLTKGLMKNRGLYIGMK